MGAGHVGASQLQRTKNQMRTRRRSQHLPRREFKTVMTIQPLTHSRSLALGQV
jgi:hypothetical protein